MSPKAFAIVLFCIILLIVLCVSMTVKSDINPWERIDYWFSRSTQEGKDKKKSRKLRSVLPLVPIAFNTALLTFIWRAGLTLQPSEFMIMLFSISAALGLVGAMLQSFTGLIIGASFGLILPIFAMRMKAAKRLKKVESQLPPLLETMSAGLRSGYSFLQVLEMVAKETTPPLGKEIELTFREMSITGDPTTALNNLVQRTGSVNLELAATAILIQREIGGNLAEILDNITSVLRDRIKVEGEVKALTAQGKLAGLVIGILPFALMAFIMVMDPHYLDPLFYTESGNKLLMVAGAFMVVGILMVRKIVNVKY